MGYFTVVISILFVLFIPLVEKKRKKTKVFDFLSGINLVYFITFGVAPLYIYFFYEYTTWKTIRLNDIEGNSFFYAGVYSLFFYIFIIIGYYFSSRFLVVKKINTLFQGFFDRITDKTVFKISTLIFFVGFVSLIIYINVLGGFSTYLTSGAIIRSANNTVFVSPFMFFKTIASLIYMSAFLYWAMFVESRKNRIMYLMLFLISFTFSLLHLYHTAGRLTIIMFLITFPLAKMYYNNRIYWKKTFITVFLFFVVVIIGDSILNGNNTQPFYELFLDKFNNFGYTFGIIIQEFTFPLTNLANSIIVFPENYNFRYGMDFLIGIQEILPSRLLNFDFMKADTLSELNSFTLFEVNYTIPVDAVTFGYVSFGIVGVIIAGFLLGVTAKFIEAIFDIKNNYVAAMFYTSWLMAVGVMVLYGDPAQVYAAKFRLFIPSLLLVLFALAKKLKLR